MPIEIRLEETQEITFVAADWAAGVVNTIDVTGPGIAAGAGQVGPHRFAAGGVYLIQVYRDNGAGDHFIVDLQMRVTAATGTIRLTKAAAVVDFAGTVILGGNNP